MVTHSPLVPGEDFLYVFKPALTGRTGGVAAVRLLPPARRPARARPPQPPRALLDTQEGRTAGTTGSAGHEQRLDARAVRHQ